MTKLNTLIVSTSRVCTEQLKDPEILKLDTTSVAFEFDSDSDNDSDNGDKPIKSRLESLSEDDEEEMLNTFVNNFIKNASNPVSPPAPETPDASESVSSSQSSSSFSYINFKLTEPERLQDGQFVFDCNILSRKQAEDEKEIALAISNEIRQTGPIKINAPHPKTKNTAAPKHYTPKSVDNGHRASARIVRPSAASSDRRKRIQPK
jgi:hypothetical protein